MNIISKPNPTPPTILPSPISPEDKLRLSGINQIETTLKGRTFKTQEIPLNPENNFQITKIMQAWETIADKKAKQPTPPLERHLFSSSSCITGLITDDLKTDTTDLRVFTCYHQTIMHSIAVVREYPSRSLYIDYLATHPLNIRSSVNPQETQVPYAGTALMNHLFQTCVKEEKTGIGLYSFKNSKGFYKKLKFKSVNKYVSFGPMSISSEEIKKQLKKIAIDSSSIDHLSAKRKRVA